MLSRLVPTGCRLGLQTPPLHGSRGIARRLAHAACLLLALSPTLLQAQVPLLLNYQGRLVLAGTNYDGNAQFKFALVDGAGTTSFWSHDGSSTGGAAPSTAVSLPVTRGFYSILLGDTNVANMTSPVAASVFATNDVRLRVWFSDGVGAFRLLTPDQRVASVGYALVAATSTGPVAESQLPSAIVAGAQAAQAGTAANVPGAIVRRDANGNLAAGTISGTFNGDGSGLTNLPAATLLAGAPSGSVLVSSLAADATLLAQNYRAFMATTAPAWVQASTVNTASARYRTATVWTGQEMIAWGGLIGSSLATASGGIYDPANDSWSATSAINAPAARSGHAAVWTGTQLLVWGGTGNGESSYLATGGRLRLNPQSWSTITTTGAPEARSGHIAVWTGSRLLVWGGRNTSGLLNDGALYDPTLNQWSALSVPDAPAARSGAAAAWTGDRLILWGGLGASGPLNTGAQLLFTSGTPSQWSPLPSAGAPAARIRHTGVWTGDALLIWGGSNDDGFLNNGASFKPSTDTWTAVAATAAPTARADHIALWTGSELLVITGIGSAGELSSGSAYEPVTQKWRALTTLGNPTARTLASGVWSGSECLLFGGQAGSTALGSPQRLSPQPVWHFYRKL